MSAALLSCRHFGACGGCSRLLEPIERQREDKQSAAAAVLRAHVAGQDLAWTTPPDPIAHHRTKLLYPVQPRDGRIALGIYRRATHDVVPIRECQTQDEALTEFAIRAERVVNDMRLTPYDETTGKGFFRALHARLAPGTGELLVGVVTRGGRFEAAAELAARLADAAQRLPRTGRHAPRLAGIVRSLHDRPANFLLGDRHVPLLGRDHQFDRQGRLTFRITFGSFYQVHREQERTLYRPCFDLLGDLRGQRVIDGYGGIGAFGLRAAAAGATDVLVVESSRRACGDAEANARANRLPQVRVLCAPFAGAQFPPAPDLVIVDPPRSGLLAEGVARLLAARPRRVLLVSCGLAGLAADLGGLAGGGYRVAAVRLCDMFPHADHLEVVTLLETASRGTPGSGTEPSQQDPSSMPKDP
jgi:23S rRNA (uracil1939-C5)-methyltransferase